MKHLDATVWFLTENTLHWRWTYKSDRGLNKPPGQDHDGTILRMGRRMSLGKSNLKDA